MPNSKQNPTCLAQIPPFSSLTLEVVRNYFIANRVDKIQRIISDCMVDYISRTNPKGHHNDHPLLDAGEIFEVSRAQTDLMIFLSELNRAIYKDINNLSV